MIPTEDNYVDWILSSIREYYDEISYTVYTYSISQVRERQCPVDRILAVGNKIVGLQFKRPQTTERPWQWKLTPHQHKNISEARWIFYCLPEFVDLRFHKVALYHCQFRPAYADETDGVSLTERPFYYRWGAFADALDDCREGLEIGNERQIHQLFNDLSSNTRDTYLSLNKLAREAYIVRGSPSPREMDYEPA